MVTQQLPRPSLPGDTLRAAAGGSHILLDGNPPGVVSIDPWTVQCARCGAVDECPPPRKWTTFLLTCGYEFHICTSGSEGRLCRDCRLEVAAACEVGRCRL